MKQDHMEDEQDEAPEAQEEEPWDLLSQALGSLGALESDEDYAFDLNERSTTDGGDGFSKVPLDGARNLLEIRKLAAGIKAGTMSVEKYRSSLLRMVRGLEEGLKVFNSDTVKKYLKELPDDQRPYFLATARLTGKLVQGGRQMLLYPETKLLTDVDAGLAIVEEGFAELDAVQDQVIALGREVARD